MNTNTRSLKDKAKKLYREYEAIYTLINAMTVSIKEKMCRTYAVIEKLDRTKLRNFIQDTQKEVSKLRHLYGVKRPNTEIVELLESAERSSGSLLLIPKNILRIFFSHYEKALPDFNAYPEHTRIGIDVGIYREFQGSVEIYLLEAVLFENMCALFNLTKERHVKTILQTDSKKSVKTTSALSQATVTQAFNFIEAYLNGLSFNYCVKKTDLDDKTRTFLTEWDYTKNKPKYISLRDKILHYPRIIRGVEHPPLQESNCDEIEFVVSRAKIIRDAIVHASPLPNLHTLEPDKERIIYSLKFEEVEQVVDNVISLVQKIEMLIYGNTKRLPWLHKREPDGFFHERVFD